MVSLHVSKMGYSNKPHLVEITLSCPRCHLYWHPQFPYQHRHLHHCSLSAHKDHPYFFLSALDLYLSCYDEIGLDLGDSAKGEEFKG